MVFQNSHISSYMMFIAVTLAISTGMTRAEESAKTKYQLQYQFEQGHFVKYHVKDRSAYTTRKKAIAETVRNESQQWRHYRVVAINEAGEATLELMIDRARLVAQFDDSKPTIFDSADPNLQPPKMQSIMNSIGKSLCRMRVSPQGELVHVQSLNGDKSLESDPAINFLVVFPEHDVAIGEAWTQTLEVEVPVTDKLKEKVKLLRKYTLESVNGDIAHIKVYTVIATIIRDPAVQTRLMTQAPAGTIEFDIARGVMISRTLSVDDQVVGAFGAGTLVHAQNERTEKLQEETDVAEKTQEISKN